MTLNRQEFGTTWWGVAWANSLERQTQFTPNSLAQGRIYARQHRVNDVAAEPGVVTAKVHGSQPTPYRVQIRIRQFDEGEWSRAFDAIASHVDHANSVINGDLNPDVLEDVASVGLDLLPGAGDLSALCSCPDWATPCQHAVAVCYLIAELIDRDPFVGLLMRGRTRDEVVTSLQGQRTADTLPSLLSQQPGDDTMLAREAWGPGRTPNPQPGPDSESHGLLVPPNPREYPGHPPSLLVEPPIDSGVLADDLVDAMEDASHRAWELLVGESDGDLNLDFDTDLARRAARAIGTPRFDQIAEQVGWTGKFLLERALAWRQGGVGGLAVAEESWRPSAELLDEARDQLRQLDYLIRIRDNRITLVGTTTQLRLGKDGGWYRFELRAGTWELTGPPGTDLMDALGEIAETS